jgi:hypothetical protein
VCLLFESLKDMSVIVDDHDAQVQYSGEWISAGTSTEYNSTTSTSQTRGDTAKFEFVGAWTKLFLLSCSYQVLNLDT